MDDHTRNRSPVGILIDKLHGDAHFYATPQRKPKPILPFEPETCPVPAAEFLMGHPMEVGIPSNEAPMNTLYLPDFSMGRYPVTQRQYQAFIQANPKQEIPANWRLRKPPADQLDYPVTGVSIQDALAYCKWLSAQTERHYRLPSEAEWEKAARGRSGNRYPWGNQWRDGVCNAAGAGVAAVNRHTDGASEYGCEDLLGNVQQWTRTCWGSDLQHSDYPYPYQPGDGREITDTADNINNFFIYRGGCWRDQSSELRCTVRNFSKADSRVPWRGFRVVLLSDD